MILVDDEDDVIATRLSYSWTTTRSFLLNARLSTVLKETYPLSDFIKS